MHISELIKEKKAVDPLKEIKKYCFERAKREYLGKKPFGMYWGTNTSHLKTLSDWAFAKSNADQEYQSCLREGKEVSWFKIFFGQLRPQKWHKK